jgi:N-acetylglucosamine-6-phosphate deacetylase
MIHAKGPRAILTSDAVHIAGLPPGRYRLNQTDVILEPNGFLHLAENPDMLAGSATPLHGGLQFVAISGISTLGEAIQMASLHPAQMFRLDGQGVGKLESGSPADFFLYQWGEDQTLRIVRTISNGSIVYEA